MLRGARMQNGTARRTPAAGQDLTHASWCHRNQDDGCFWSLGVFCLLFPGVATVPSVGRHYGLDVKCFPLSHVFEELGPRHWCGLEGYGPSEKVLDGRNTAVRVGL